MITAIYIMVSLTLKNGNLKLFGKGNDGLVKILYSVDFIA